MDVPSSCDDVVLGQTCKIMCDRRITIIESLSLEKTSMIMKSNCEVNVKTLISKTYQILWAVPVKQVNRNTLVARTVSIVFSLSPTSSSRIFMEF